MDTNLHSVTRKSLPFQQMSIFLMINLFNQHSTRALKNSHKSLSKLQNKLKSYWKLWNHFWLTELQILDSILSVANYQGIWLRLKWFARKTIILPRMIPLSSILCMFLVKFGRKTILPLLYLSVCRNSYTVFSRNSS